MLLKGNKHISKNTRSILLIQLGDIGDVVVSLPAIRAVKENFPRANLVVAVREKAAELIEDCPWTDDVLSVSQKQQRWHQKLISNKNLIFRMWKNKFDMVIDLRNDSRGAVLALLSGARQRIGFFAKDGTLWRNQCYTNLFLPFPKPGRHIADLYASFIYVYGLNIEKVWPEVVVPKEKIENAKKLFKVEKIPSDRLTIAVQPFSLWRYKEWEAKKYVDLIRQIRDEYDLSVIITGAPDERARADDIVRDCGVNVYNLAGKTSIGMFAAVLKLCELFIGGDSAGIHIAAGVGTPTVGIFGPISSEAWAPRGAEHLVVSKGFSCQPCHQKGCQGRGVSRCLEELTPDEVLPTVKSQIEKLRTEFED